MGGEWSSSRNGSVATGKSCVATRISYCGSGSGDSERVVGNGEVNSAGVTNAAWV